MPCLFPNVELPVVEEDAFYPVYFSRGVLLDGALIRTDPTFSASEGRLVQVFRAGDVGAAAASDLATGTAAGRSVLVPLSASPDEAELAAAIGTARAGDRLVLWLRPADLARLPVEPPAGVTVFASGTLGGLERAPLGSAWRPVTTVAYPVDLPEQRQTRMNFPLRWFQVAGIKLTHERVQVDTYLSCVILSETLGHMLDSFVPDYLVERAEVLLSHRLVNGFYPRLGLAPGQRFASKGGYLVTFADPSGTRVTPKGGWVIP